MRAIDEICPSRESCQEIRDGHCRCRWDVWMQNHQDAWPLVELGLTYTPAAFRDHAATLPGVVHAVRAFNGFDKADIGAAFRWLVVRYIAWEAQYYAKRERLHLELSEEVIASLRDEDADRVLLVLMRQEAVSVVL